MQKKTKNLPLTSKFILYIQILKFNNIVTITLSQVLRPTSYGKWVGGPMSLKQGNFSFRARTAQNWLRMGKYGTYLEFNRSQEAPKHCPTFDSLIQCCDGAHFRLPPVCPQFDLATDGHVWHISGIQQISGSPQALLNLRFTHSMLCKSSF